MINKSIFKLGSLIREHNNKTNELSVTVKIAENFDMCKHNILIN